ncbi:probable disease resistance protein At4g27220 isoform X2 [Pistacia vera]|nr:probable disease resistance protein At4g27220 isoform X2 [Pistacia vera]
MEKAKEQVEKVKIRKQDVEADVDVAERQGEEIYNEVKDWLRGVEGFMEREVKLVDDEDIAKRRCFKGLCPDLMKRYRLSKDAEQVAEDGAKLFEKGKFSGVSHHVILQRTESIFVGEGYEHFHSRESNFNDIMEALKDSTVNMIGVYGMGGVGKTTLVRTVAWKAKEDNLFDVVVFAEVKQNPNLKQIQADIAGQLGMVLRDQESLSGRADQLRYRLKKAKRIIVIVDNIWKKLDLKVVGIPFGYDDKGSIQQDKKESNNEQERCTILLTARTQVVLKQMNTHRNVFVEPLGDDDARNWFGNIAGDLTDKSDIAAEIIEKCAGLPLAITIIAKALKGKSDSVWRDALRQLENSNTRCVPEMDNTLYSTIELSYELLNSEEAKSLLLLCALLVVAGHDVPMMYLLGYGMGLGLFQDVHTINDGRNRVKSLIDYLADSCLLLKGNNNEKVKMHDVIHLVVASIAKEKRWLSIPNANGFKEVLAKGKYKDSVAIILPGIDIDGLPERVNFPNLELFTSYLKEDHFLQIPNHFFEGMKELKVLDLDEAHLLPLPSSFLCLTNLQMLRLGNCTLGDITMIGELRNLEILAFLNCEFEQLPESFRQLTQLKLLQLTDCPKLKVITPNVIANLSRLEELRIYNSFERWEVEGRNNASLAELKRLSQLNTLCIHIPNLQLIQRDFIPENLEKYTVHIGDAWEWAYEYEPSRTLRLKVNGSLHLTYGVEILVEKAKYLYLDQLDGVKDILWELDREGFPQLKHLSVQSSSEVLYIVNSIGCVPSNHGFPILESLFLVNLSNMEKICCGLVGAKSFSKLRILKVKNCNRLRYLFSSSMAGNISQIQKIKVTYCEKLKEIFGKESEDHVDENERNSEIEFTQLHSLVLQCLPQFISFGLKVVLPRLENLKISSINIENIWVDQPQPMSSYMQCLKSLYVGECNSLKYIFLSSMVKCLVQLQKLVICYCKSMEALIFDSEGLEGEDKIIEMSFPKLFHLKLASLPKLTRFGTRNSIEFPTLNELHIESCSNLKIIDMSFPNLETLEIRSCDSLKEVFNMERQLNADRHTLKKSHQEVVDFNNLKSFEVHNCCSLRHIFTPSIILGLAQLK